MSTLDKLKQKLNLSGASKGLENVGKAAKGVSFAGMSSGIETVQAKFSALQVAGVTALANITNQAVNTGKRMISALTIDPVKSGFQEYETQIGAIQTILSNTRQEGTNVDIVNKALDELNTYADKTIYNFTEMTRNIGTFTAAGVKLDTSVNAIKGIANLAAVSGSTSQQASTAMYQLSQALAAGKVSLMDWNSVVNAGMGGKVFQDALVRTSELLGTGAKQAIDTYGSFRESLTKGEWLTTEVLTETLNQLSGAYSKADLIAQGYSESQANDIMALAKDAEDAATKVKTFTQLIDTVKESLQSGWGQTWRILVGDFEDSKELFTGISDTIGKMVESSAKSRNELLEGAMSSNWDKLVKKINEAGVETDTFEEKVRSIAEDHGVNMDEIIKKYGSLEKAFQSGAISSDILKEAVSGLKGELVDLSGVEAGLSKGNTGDDVTKVQKALQSLNYDIGDSGADGIFGSATESAIKAFQEANDLEITGIVDDATLKALNEANESTNKLKDNIDGLIDGITELGGREKIIEGLKNIFKFLGDIIKPIKEAFREIFPPTTVDQVVSMIDRFKAFTDTLKVSEGAASKIKSTFKGIFSAIDIVIEAFKAVGKGALDIIGNFTGLGGGILDATSSFGDFISNVRDSIVEGNLFGDAVDKIVGFLSNGISKIAEFGRSLIESFKISPTLQGFLGFFSGLWNTIKSVGAAIGEAFSDIGNMIADAFGKGDIFEVLNSGLFAGILLAIRNFIKGLSDPFEKISFLDNVKKILDGVKGSLESWQQNLKAGTLLKIAGAIGILAAALFVISGIDEDKLGSSLGAIGGLFVELISALAVLEKINSKSVKPLSGIVSSLSGIARTVQMIGLGAAILILAGAMKIIAGLDWNGVAKGLVGIGGMVAILVAAAKLMNTESKSITKFAGQMLILSAAIAALSGVAKILSSMSWEELAKGGAGILGIVAILVGAAKLMNTESKSITKFAGQMLIMSAAVGILAAVGKSLGSMSWNELAKGGAGILGIVTMLVLASKIMSKGSGSIAKFGGQMLLMASALAILTPVLKSLGSMSWESIGKGLVVLGIALVELSIGLKAMSGSLKGSAALVVAAAGLAILTPVLKSLGSMSWESIVKGLVTLAGAFVVIGVAGALLSPLTPAILGLSAAMAIFAVAIAGIGVGILALSAGFTALATAGTAGATALVASITVIITGILGLIPQIAEVIGRGIVEIAKVIGEYAPQLAESFLKLLLGVLDALEQYAPQIVDSLLGFIIGVINSLAEHTPELISAIMNFVGQVVKGIVDSIGNLDMDTMLKGIGAFGVIGILMKVFAGAGALAGPAMTGVLAVGAVIAEIAVLLAAIGGLSKIPGFSSLVEAGGGLLGKIGNAIGKGIGAFIGGIGEGITGSLPEIGQNIADFMDKLAIASENASGIKSGSFDGVSDLMSAMAEIGFTTVGTSIADIFTLGGTSMEKFETDGVAFFNAMKAISQASAGITIDEAAMGAVINVATKLSELQSSLEPIGGVMDWFSGRDDLATFGTNVGQFIFSMKNAFLGLDGVSFNTEALTSIITGAAELSKLQSSLEPIGGVISWFKGRDDLGTFGESVGEFISSMKVAFSDLEGITLNTEGLTAIISATTILANLQSSLEPIGGVISWFKGRDDLGTFGTNVAQFIFSMKTAFQSLDGVEFNSEALTTIIDGSTKLAGLQSALEPIGGVISWFKGRDDLGTFGVNIGLFIGSMTKAFSSLDGVKINTEAIGIIIDAATKLSGLQSSLENIGGVVDWFTGRDDLGTFGSSVASFMGSMKTAFADLGDTKIDDDSITSIINAATKLAGLQSSLENMGGVIDWFTGKDDLGTFGENIGQFATAMGKLKTGMGEDGISEAVVTSVTNAGSAIIALQEALPEEGWFDGKMNLEEFSKYVEKFSSAMTTFSTDAANINSDGINTAITAAYRIKNLITALADLDASGVSSFAGVGAGDGHLVNIGQAIGKFGESVADIDIAKVNTAVSVALRLKSLIASLVGLDTSGIENFKINSIGKAMQDYGNSVKDMDPGIVSSSISSANRLRNFVSSLTGLDSSGVSNFKIGSIGTTLKSYSKSVENVDSGKVTSSVTAANRLKTFIQGLSSLDSSGVSNFKIGTIGSTLKSYSDSVAGINVGSISSSITAATKIKNFISSLAGLNTSGVASFKTAVSTLGQTSMNSITKSFSGSTSKMSNIGSNLITSFSNGLKSKQALVTSTATNIINSMLKAISSKRSVFGTNGVALMTQFVNGMRSRASSVVNTTTSILSSAVSSTRGYYSSFYSSGSYVASGFVAGIQANIWSAANAAASMAAAASAAARANLAIHSPSRVFMKIGSYVPIGFAKGIGMFGGLVKQSISRMSDNAVNSTQTAMSRISSLLDGDINTQPTIRPVLDLSDIKSGASAINGMLNGTPTLGVMSRLNTINSMMGERIQNGSMDDVVSAINRLRKDLGNVGGVSYNINGLTYDDGSNITEAVKEIVRAAVIERRI
jgi:peptidoglycan hydrolase-like protein with peptidoglycan-binding domain